MKILFIDQCAQLAGGELNLYDYLRSAPESASVVLLEDGPFRGLLQDLGIPVEVVPLRAAGEVRRGAGLISLLRVFPTLLRLRRRLRALAGDAEVVYANSQKAFLLAALACRRGQPLIWHLHDIFSPEHFSAPLRKLSVFAGNRFADVVIVNSEATAKAYRDAGGSAGKVRTVYCGLDPHLFAAVDPERVAALRTELLMEKYYTVAVFSRLASWKGQHVLLDAVSELLQVQGIIVGEAFFGEDAYKQQLLERAAQPDLAGRIKFLGFRKDVPELMLAVDAVVHTSVSAEPFGRVIVEGLLADKPVIATFAGGPAELIEHGRSGLLISPGSVVELRDAIEQLRTNKEAANLLAAAGRERALGQFTLQLMVQKIRAIVEEQSMKARG